MTDRFPAIILLFFLLSSPGWSEAPAVSPSPSPEPEAPESIFDMDVGDVGVKLDAQGTWTSRLSAGWGEGLTPQATLQGQGYPGLENGVIFNQLPDFTLDLRLMDRYYLDVNFAGDLNQRTYLAGYDGQPGEFLQWVKLGDTPFLITPRAGQTFVEGRPGDLAAGAGFTSGPVALEGAVEYQDGLRVVRTFQGYRDLAATTVAPDGWLRNQFFQLPGSGPWTAVQVLVADPAGPLNGYHVATQAEAEVNTLTGEIDLPATAAKQVLVTWSGAPATYVSPVLKIGAAALSSAPAPGNWYVLAQPGVISPFEIRNRYPLPLGTTGIIQFYEDDLGIPDPTVTAGYAPTQNWFQISGSPEAPLAARFPGIYPQSAAGVAAPPPTANTLGYSFHLPVSTTATSYSLGTGVIGSSILVTRNGLATTEFHFDPASGTLSFNTPVFDTDSVVISYEEANTGNAASNLAFWQGGRWDLDDHQNLEWALQGQWNVSQTTSTTQDLESPGQFTATLAWAGTKGDWGWTIQTTGGARLTDSTGTRILYGQSDSGFQATLDGNALRPAAAPGPLGGLNLTEAARAPTYFRNYWTTDPSTGAEVVSQWGTPGIGRSPWQADGWVGPYYVQGDGIRTDQLAVVETDLGAGQWSGLSMFLNKGLPEDVSSTSAISVTLRTIESLAGTSGAPVRVFLVAGNLSRNFDGTGAVRTINYLSYPALAFTDQASGFGQNFPIPQDSTWGNDAANSGSAGQDGTLVVHELTSGSDSSLSAPLDPASTGWQTVTVNLTAAERQLLRQATGWRIVVAAPGSWSTTQTRTLLVGPTVFEGSTWSVAADGSSTGSVNPVEYTDPNRNNGHDLSVSWTADRSKWTVQGKNPPLDPRAYKTLTFEYESTAAGPLTLNLTDANGHGIHAAWTAVVTSSWQTVKVPITGGVVTANGSSVGTSTNDARSLDLDTMVLTFTNGGSVAGTFQLTEVEAVDPAWQVVEATKASLTWKQPGAWPSKEFPLVSGMTVGLTSSQAGIDQYDYQWVNQVNVEGTIGPVQATGEALVTQTADQQSFHGAYKATLPLSTQNGPSLVLSDQFSDQGLRSEEVTLGMPWVGTFHTQLKALGPPTTMEQYYQAGWASPGNWPQGWSGSASATWDQTYNVVTDLGDFGQTWTDSWSWLQPRNEVAPYCQIQGQTGFQVVPTPVGVGFNFQGRVTQAQGDETVWSPTGSWTFKVPFRIEGNPSLLVTPSVSREVDSVYNLNNPLDPAGSVMETWDELAARALAAAPFSDFFSPGSPWASAPDTLVSGSVISTAALGWERTSAADWTDLLEPYSGTVSYATNSGWASGNPYTNQTVQTSLMARGINLFGLLGSQPVFSWYRTESLAWSLTGTWETGSRVLDQNTSIGASTSLDLTLTQAESIGFPAVYSGTWGTTPAQTLSLKPTWTLKNPANLPFDLPGWVSSRQFKRQFIQNLTLDLDLGWPDVPMVRNLEFQWKGRITLSDKSELDLTAKWGQQWQENLVRIGAEVDLDLILSF